jgi:hypothetical protein
MKNIRFYLYSQVEDKNIYEATIFDADAIKEEIIDHLNNNHGDTLELCKVAHSNKFVGDDIISFFEVNKGRPCKVILKAGRTFYKKL